MVFACELMDLCRGTQEVEAVLSEGGENGFPDPLARLKMAMEYEEKKVIDALKSLPRGMNDCTYCLLISMTGSAGATDSRKEHSAISAFFAQCHKATNTLQE